tara:strand:- start:226 stop:426 length:201 start_codon:yes stop_codon:yes gene_type:complete
MDDYKTVQIMISPDAIRKIKQILMSKKIGGHVDSLDAQWGKIIEDINDKKNISIIETKKDKENEEK